MHIRFCVDRSEQKRAVPETVTFDIIEQECDAMASISTSVCLVPGTWCLCIVAEGAQVAFTVLLYMLP